MIIKIVDKFYDLIKQGCLVALAGSILIAIIALLFDLQDLLIMAVMSAGGALFALGYISAWEQDRAKQKRAASQTKRKRQPMMRAQRARGRN